MMLIFIEILCMLIFSLFVDDVLDSLFGFSFFKNTGVVTSFFFSKRFYGFYFIYILFS